MTLPWFVAALLPMVASQILRLHQQDAASWIFWDYAGRLCGLGALTAIPAARAVAFRCEARRLPLWKIALWNAGIVLVSIWTAGLRRMINTSFPTTVLGGYPKLHGWLYLLDITFGLMLVAFSEEIVFRRCARHLLQPHLGDGYRLVLTTSLLFGCYHWSLGLGAVVDVSIIGMLLMLLYQRSGALWPAVLAHYLDDLYFFV
jgi:CAAX protease family protein